MKINILKPTGSEAFNLLSAFKVEDNTYVIFDIERTSPMGLPAVYVSKLTTKLEKISNPNEWESVKKYLKGIISGTNFLYVSIPDTLNADEVYYVQLYLPSESAFDLIKTRYVVNTPEQPSTPKEEPNPQVLSVEPPLKEEPLNNPAPNSAVDLNESVIPVTSAEPTNVIPDNPIIPDAPVMPNTPVMPESVTPVTPDDSPATPIEPEVSVEPLVNTSNEETKTPELNFDADKETFLKACENMFDALISKYQKNLADLQAREQALNLKEKEIDTKLAQATEHLANAEAREQVANIAHDNAKKVMDTIPNNDTATVI